MALRLECSDCQVTHTSQIPLWKPLGRIGSGYLFHSVGILPFILGLALSWRLGNPINWPVFLLGLLAAVLIMLGTYYAGEAYDIREDTTTWSGGRNPFSGGSGIVVMGRITPRHVKRASLAALFAAILLGIFLQFGLKTGPWTLPLGLTGAIAGYYYSTPLASRCNSLLPPDGLAPPPDLMALHSPWLHHIQCNPVE